MATVKISELEEVTELSSGDVLPIVNNNKTKKVSIEKLNEILGGNTNDTSTTKALKIEYYKDGATFDTEENRKTISEYYTALRKGEAPELFIAFNEFDGSVSGDNSYMYRASVISIDDYNLSLYCPTQVNTSSSQNRYGVNYNERYELEINVGIDSSNNNYNATYINHYYTKGWSLNGNSSILGMNNTTAFTPTGDYNPATKKYVDDAVANSGGGSGVDYPHLLDYSIPINMNRQGLMKDWQNGMQVLTNIASNFSDFVNKAYNYCISGGEPMNIVLSLVFNRVTEYTNEVLPPVVRCYPSTYDLTPFTEQHNIYYLDSEILSGYTINSNFTNIKKKQFYVHIEGTWENDVFTCTNPRLFVRWTTREGLPTNNTTAFTPTGDYNPATKKYVDDAITSAITTVLEDEY